MKRILITGSLISWIGFTPISIAEESHVHPSRLPVFGESVVHEEIRIPQSLIPGLLVIDRQLTMEDAVELGLANNLGIKIARSQTDIRRAMLKGAQGERWPVISLGSLTFIRSDENQTLMTPDMMMNTVDTTLFEDLNASIRLPLFTGRRIRGGIQAARFSLLGSEAALRQSIVETAYQIRETYLNALLIKEEHLVHQAHIEIQQELLQVTSAKYRVGKGLRADVLRVQTELADAQQMLNEEHNQFNAALFDLKTALGVDLSSNVHPTETLIFTPWIGPDLNTLVQQAISLHPRIQELEQAVKEAEAQVSVARSEYLPQVYGQVTGNLRFPDRPPMMGNGVIGMVTAELPLFSRTRSAEVERARASLVRAQQELKALQLEIAEEIAKAWNELEFARQNVALSEPAVSQAEENLRLIQRRFAVGRAIQVEIQDAALSLRQAQLNRAEAVFNHELAKARLLQAIGRFNAKDSGYLSP